MHIIETFKRGETPHGHITGRGYKPTERSRKGITGADKIERLLSQVGRELYL
jgi:hypothetical protein